MKKRVKPLISILQNSWVIIVCDSLDDGLRPLDRVAALEYSASYEYALSAKLHHHGCISWCGDTSCGEVDNRELAVLVDILDEVIRYTQLLGCLIELIGIERCQTAYLALHHAHVSDSLYDVACSWLALGAYHCSSLIDTAQRLAEVLCSADERNLELAFVYMVNIIGR